MLYKLKLKWAYKHGTYFISNGAVFPFWTNFGHQRFKQAVVLASITGEHGIQIQKVQ